MAEAYHAAALAPVSRAKARPDHGLTVTPELIDEFLVSLRENGRTPETVNTYQRHLNQLYAYLPSKKQLDRNTLEKWRTDLLAEGYAARTVNLSISAVNSLLEYCERRELQVVKPLEPGRDVQPELTRTEYLRLLSTARSLGKEREYLLVKTFCSTGLTLHDLPLLTVEAAKNGRIILSSSMILHLPDCLCAELLSYAKWHGILSGPLFVTKTGKQLRRTYITKLIQGLCQDARVPEEKATPRCLKKLYQTTQASIQANISLLVEQAHDRLLETEQLAIGWNDGR